MKRDMDLVRRILEVIEAHPYSMRGVELQPEGYSPEEVTYHVLLLHEAGLLRAIDFFGP